MSKASTPSRPVIRPTKPRSRVTQGALDALDRDQLQAVIGHEFSHILNGDMKINMRLTAWIFGLFVITDLARRFMRRRGRGKRRGARQGDRVRHFHRGQRRHARRAAAAGGGLAPPRASGRCLGGAVHAQSAGAAGRVRRHGCARRGHASRRTKRPPASRTCSSPAAIRRGLTRSAARGSPRIRRSKSACARSTRASRRCDSARWSATSAARAPTKAPASARQSPHGVRRRGASALAPDAPRHARWPWRAAATPAAVTLRGTTAPRPRSQLRRAMALAETMPSGVRLSPDARCRPMCLRNRLEPGATGGDRRVRRAGGNIRRSRCRPRSSRRCWRRSRRSGARSSRGSRRCSASSSSRRRRRRSRVSRSWRRRAPAAADGSARRCSTDWNRRDRKRLRAVARAFAPTVATRRHAAIRGDAHAREAPRQGEQEIAAGAAARTRRGTSVTLYAALAQCRFGAGKQGRTPIAPASWACCRRRNGRRIRKR